MRPARAQSSGPAASCHMLSSVDFITNTFESEFLVHTGAKSPALLAEDPRVTKFVQEVSARGGVIACICRGSMLAARSKVVVGRRMTGFNDSASYPELVVQPDAEAAGATWVQNA